MLEDGLSALRAREEIFPASMSLGGITMPRSMLTWKRYGRGKRADLEGV